MPADESWSVQVDTDGVAWLTCDCPGESTNVLSATVLGQLAEHLGALRTQTLAALIITSAKSGGFIAGADIKSFGAIRTPEEAYPLVRAGQAILQQLADLPFPTIAGLHGFVLGGGLELALACTYRVAADDAALSLGLPEVLLGIHPGFGGTVRCVQLIGVQAAWQLMLTGKSCKGRQALRSGLVDRLVPAVRLRESCKELALQPPVRGAAPLRQRVLNAAWLRPLIAGRAAAMLRRRVGKDQYPAPFAILDLWREHGARGAAAYEAEARSISRLICTPTSRNLVRVFFLQERLKSLGNAPVGQCNHVHVIGAGVMGGDIAAWCAYRGMHVTLQDRTEALVSSGLARARAWFDKRTEDKTAADLAFGRLQGDVQGSGVAQADVVIEAIVESVEAKCALYAQLEPRLKAQAVLATNTSGIMIETLSARLQDPGHLVGIHFFNPVAQMQLVEIVRGQQTRESVFQHALQFTKALHKLPLPCRSAPGFVVNRILTPYLNEALLAMAGGIPAALIDRTAVRFGMPMGPIELTDVVGLDVSLHVGRVIAGTTREVPQVLMNRVEQGKLGRKSGEGFYVWRDGKALKPDVRGVEDPPDLEDRLVLAMVNEAAACLGQGVIEDADLLDAGAVFATGFAPFRGGPLHYAKDRGIDAVTRRLGQLAEQYGERFRPDPAWDLIRRL